MRRGAMKREVWVALNGRGEDKGFDEKALRPLKLKDKQLISKDANCYEIRTPY